MAAFSGLETDGKIAHWDGSYANPIPLAFYAILWPQWWREQQQNYYSNGYPGWKHRPNLAADARGERGDVR